MVLFYNSTASQMKMTAEALENAKTTKTWQSQKTETGKKRSEHDKKEPGRQEWRECQEAVT